MSKNERYRLRPQGLPLPPYIVIINHFVSQPRILFQYRISRRYDDQAGPIVIVGVEEN